jgi:apolipoprotein N-acyltransferase
VWSAAGAPGAYYDKTHPVPFGEYIPFRGLLASRISLLDQIPNDMIPGSGPGVLSVGPARVGVLMCFEVAYDGLVRQRVDGGAQLLAVPTNNATYIRTGQVDQQFAISRLRAIETGRYVVVAATDGISGVIAPDGRVVARALPRSRAVLEARVALTTRVTTGVRVGAWVERAAAFAGLVALLYGILARRRRRAAITAPSALEQEPEPVRTGRA